MGLKNKQSGGAGRGVALVLILGEVFGAIFFGVTMLDNFGSEAIRAVTFSTIGAGLAGVVAYIVLHSLPGIRWLMMAAMVLLWAFVAYSLGLMVIGDEQESFHFVAHKGPYIAAAIAALFRAVMYR